MNRLKLLRLLGMLGALSTGIAMLMTGDIINGTGVIAAAFSSSAIIAGQSADTKI